MRSFGLQRHGAVEVPNKPGRPSQLHWVHDYSAAITSAVAWLGDRYLLATPVNTTPARRVHRGDSKPHGYSPRSWKRTADSE